MKVVALVAHTIDGFIARDSKEFIDWSSKEDKKMFVALTKKGGVIVMGSNTYKTIGKPLKERLNVVLTSKAKKLKSQDGVLEYWDAKPKQVVEKLTKRGFKVVYLIGGAHTYTKFLRAKLVDELWVTIEPVIFGSGLSNFTESFYNVKCSLTGINKLNSNTVQLKYKLTYGN